MIKMIVCADAHGGIGSNNDLLYNIPDDMKFFRETTLNHKIVMGYNTWLSLPKKPLPKRENYVLYDGEETIEGAHVLKSLDEVIELGKTDDIFIIGGAMVYNEMIKNDLIDEAYITIVNDICYSADRHIDIFEVGRNLNHIEVLKKISFQHYFKEVDAIICKFYR